MGPKKSTKMSLNAFLGDESFGSTNWADDIDDLPALPQDRTTSTYRATPSSADAGYNAPSSTFESVRSPPESRREGGMGSGYQRDAIPIPSEPPFTAHVGNLSFDLTENDLGDFFGEGVTSIRLVIDPLTERSRGFGYVEFETADTLSAALALSGEDLMGRPVRITVAEPRRSFAREERSTGDWVRRGPLPPAEPAESPFGKRRTNSGRFRDPARDPSDRVREEPREWVRRGPLPPRESSERPRLNLKPRSSSNVNTEATPSATTTTSSKPKRDPFGGAKPVDNTSVLQRVEEKLAKRTQSFRREDNANRERSTSRKPSADKAEKTDKTDAIAEKVSDIRLGDGEKKSSETDSEVAATKTPATEDAPATNAGEAEEEEGWTKIGKGRKH
ncbi:translation initiation factor [Schizosaccharomyces pombe]|uniref:Probable RNA-binding protein sce3 n=1 Tax=Schizosaccharomyces pombe (strain 972 / ATCC 24843) TaxID=284812 RepID=SCE3_SCHPO|nr:putative translation initiation factor [Schizosaccharomyces pombe]O14369.1 RecName: Full=Probable RNA-binding protein sce3 [Schizosaccharomyces pombe 972h-]CAA03989.1 putative RNA-binding protein [Schizosaccharomyces pombe]CAA18401.1 translation initiation factor (predicted) [Schizosaccharomyces pombe]|eukprot:NP_595728.1 putative translation initiation factor [Schizosaccharomyces pombe]